MEEDGDVGSPSTASSSMDVDPRVGEPVRPHAAFTQTLGSLWKNRDVWAASAQPAYPPRWFNALVYASRYGHCADCAKQRDATRLPPETPCEVAGCTEMGNKHSYSSATMKHVHVLPTLIRNEGVDVVVLCEMHYSRVLSAYRNVMRRGTDPCCVCDAVLVRDSKPRSLR
jgi:hypothetical protein